MYEASQLGSLAGRRSNYRYASVDYKIAEYMGTATQADADRLNVLAYHAAKARAAAKKTGITGAVKQALPYAIAVAATVATAGAATPGAIAWAVGSTAVQEKYVKDKAKKQQKDAEKKSAVTVAEIKRLEAEAARVQAETDKMIAASQVPPKVAKAAINQAAAQQQAKSKAAMILPWLALGVTAVKALT